MKTEKYETKLTGVPETLLWTLHNRASESKRSDGIIKDKKAEEIYDSIDYDYEKSFGKAEPSHAVRSFFFDKEVKKFIEKNKKAIIINLGEGLETQRYRISTKDIIWYSVDLKETIDVREKFIQPDDEHKHIACSVLDRQWLDDIPNNLPTMITAQGLLMYFEEKQVKQLINNIAEHFNQATFIFDTIPIWFSQKTIKGFQKTKYYQAPQMPWGINRDKIEETLTNWEPNIQKIELIEFDFPKGLSKRLLRRIVMWRMIYNIPILKYKLGAFVKVEMSKVKN